MTKKKQWCVIAPVECECKGDTCDRNNTSPRKKGRKVIKR